MKKIIIIILVVIGIAGTNAVQYFIQDQMAAEREARYTNELLTLQSQIDAIGPVITCWTPKATTYSGQIITEDCLIEQSIPESFVTDSYVLDKSELLGKYFKIALDPGTPVTADTVMSETIDDTTREIDITGNRWTVGLKTGDYVDFRITMPYGQDYIVLSHLRVMSITEKSLKVYLTEAQQHIYLSALVDYYLNKDEGCDIYLTKYVEPGVQEPATVYYAPSAEVRNTMLKDPNIVDDALANANAGLRTGIDNALNATETKEEQGSEDEGKLSSGRQEFNSSINNDYIVEVNKGEEEEKDDSLFSDEEVLQ